MLRWGKEKNPFPTHSKVSLKQVFQDSSKTSTF